jgi:hypothetical protein
LTLNGAITAGWMQITYSPSDALTPSFCNFVGATRCGVGSTLVRYDPQTDFAAETVQR